MTRLKPTRSLWVLVFPALVLLSTACVPPATVFLSPNYRPAGIKKVALVTFTDYPAMAGSGQLVSGIFGNLLLKDYALADPSEVAATMQQLSLQPGSPLDAGTLHTLAAKLGVDAFVLGQVTDFTDASDQTMVEDIPIEQDTPIYSPVETAGRGGRMRTRMMVTGTDFNTVEQPEQETVSVPAHVGLSISMVDAATGDVLWSASDSDYGDYLNDASQEASSAILKVLEARLKKLGA